MAMEPASRSCKVPPRTAVGPVNVLTEVRVVVVLPERAKPIAPAMTPPKVLLSVVVSTAPDRPVIVPPCPGRMFELARPRTTWLLAPRLTTAVGLLIERNVSVALEVVPTTVRVLSVPDARLSVPPLTETSVLAARTPFGTPKE